MNFENNDIITILEKWSNKYKRSIDCSNPKGFSQKAHCAGRKKRKRGGKTKSRPVESLQEKTMSEKKDFIMTEIEKAISREVAKKNIRQSSKNLYEAVSAATKVLNENSSEKKKNLAESLIVVAEKKLKEDYDELDSIDSCNCGEGEGEMFKAQLLSIISNAEKLYHMIDDEDQFEDWLQSKVTIAEDYLRAIYSYLTYSNGGDLEDEDWDGDGDWDDVDDEDWDEESFDDDGMDVGVPNYDEALDADVDDDEIFENKKR
jgi:hypothetical protein